MLIEQQRKRNIMNMDHVVLSPQELVTLCVCVYIKNYKDKDKENFEIQINPILANGVLSLVRT